jgi:hypothetical protein
MASLPGLMATREPTCLSLRSFRLILRKFYQPDGRGGALLAALQHPTGGKDSHYCLMRLRLKLE